MTSYPSIRKCKIDAGMFWLFAVLKDKTRIVGNEGREGGGWRTCLGLRALCTRGGGVRRKVAEWKSSGLPSGNLVSEALLCKKGPRNLEWGWRSTVQGWKFVTGMLVRMPWESCAQPRHRHCGEKDVLPGLWRHLCLGPMHWG